MLDCGDRVELIRDRTQDRKDRYGRLLRYVKRKGRDVCKRQARKVWAKVYVYERPFDRLRSYRKTKRNAKCRNRGVWKKRGGSFHKRISGAGGQPETRSGSDTLTPGSPYEPTSS